MPTRRRPAKRAVRSPRTPPETWSVYVAECSDGTLYVGIARDVAARLAAHNAGRGARYTRTRRPVRLVHSETWPDLRSAMRREREIKGWSRPAKVQRLGLAERGVAACLDRCERRDRAA